MAEDDNAGMQTADKTLPHRLIAYILGILACALVILCSILAMLLLTHLFPVFTGDRGLHQVRVIAVGLGLIGCAAAWQRWFPVSQLLLGLVPVEALGLAIFPAFSGLPLLHPFNIAWSFWLAGVVGLPWLIGLIAGHLMRRHKRRRGSPA